MEYHLTPVRKAIIKKTRNNTFWKGRAEENPSMMLVGMEIGIATMKNNIKSP